MKNTESLPTLPFESQQDWEVWLHEHHTEPKGIWLKLAKKGTGIATVSYAEALDVAIRYGWIDGQKAAFDDQYWLQKFTPRGRKSIWSKVNCDKALKLIADGTMQPAGLKQVELAKADGRWDAAYPSQSKVTIPEDLQNALDKNPEAKDFFNTLDSRNRYAILFRIHTVKRAETRAAHIQKFVEMLSRREKLYP